MELASLSFDYAEIFDSWPKSPCSLDSAGKLSRGDSLDAEDAENYAFLESVLKDDKAEFIYHAKRRFVGEGTESHRSEALKLLNACCAYDSLDCASSLVNGDVEWVPYINDVDADTGLSPLHTAAEAHAPRCVEMLLKRRARTDIRSKDGRALLPLELSLCNVSLDVTWNPSGDSIGDLILMLGDKDLTVVRLLAEKKKVVETVAYAYARAGAIVPLTALLLVATDKIREATIALQDDDYKVSSKPKTTIYESVIQEVMHINGSMQSECSQKRTLLLREIELLQLFGASEFVDNRTSPLITIVQAGDEAVLELLLNINIDVNETDAEGNTALQCCLKASAVPHKQQTRIMCLLIAHGTRVSQRNKLGLSVVHFAAANGNLSALEILLAANPESVHVKTVIKETPLFFAVKNNHLACVELLLRCGASTEIHNLRKQRPIELTQSQDIRFLLNPTNISGFRKETEVAELHSAVPTKAEETSFIKTSVPVWLKKFVNWLPRYLRDTSDSWGEIGYPISSLKADFRAVFGMDLDHASLGFSKLSDFIKSFPKLCQMKVVPLGKCGPATHWVLLPAKSCQLKGKPPEAVMVNLDESISPKKTKASSTTDLKCSGGFTQEAHVSKTLKSVAEEEPPLTGSYSDHHQLKHPILETLARIRNSTSVFFLREFDFYQSYETCLRQGICFWCNQSMLLWANFPCGHKLWCSGCKQEVTQSAGRGGSLGVGDEHRCVVCDAKVERFILFPPIGFDHHRLSNDRRNKAELTTSFLQYLSMKKSNVDRRLQYIWTDWKT